MGSRHRNASISVIFFDLDNTLIPTRKGDRLAINKLSEILWEKYSIPSEVAVLRCNNFLRAFRKCPDNPNVDLDTWRHLLWAQALGDQYTNIAGEVYLKWLQLRYHYLALTPEIAGLLDKLQQHYLLGLITNGPSRAQWEKVHRLRLERRFDVVLVSGDLPWEKPQQQIFHEACEFLGVEPRQCLMVGDKLETDILGGIQAKLGCTVWIPLSTSVATSSSSSVAMCSGELDDSGTENLVEPDYTILNVIELLGLLPNNPRVPEFRKKKTVVGVGGNATLSRLRSSVPDLDDCNSNSSDGS